MLFIGRICKSLGELRGEGLPVLDEFGCEGTEAGGLGVAGGELGSARLGDRGLGRTFPPGPPPLGPAGPPPGGGWFGGCCPCCGAPPWGRPGRPSPPPRGAGAGGGDAGGGRWKYSTVSSGGKSTIPASGG